MSRKDKILNGNALYTFIAIIIGFVAGAVLLAVAGINPGLAYGKLLNGVFGQATLSPVRFSGAAYTLPGALCTQRR